MKKNCIFVMPVVVAVLAVMLVGSSISISAYGHFKNIPPIKLRTADGKQYKFDIDYLQDSGAATGEPKTFINQHPRGDSVNLKRGQEITVNYGAPFGHNDFVRVSLLKGTVSAHQGVNGYVRFNGQSTTFLEDYSADGISQGQVPLNAKTGTYKFVVLVVYNEELKGYYVTDARIR
jgi:hypothetical protein